MSVRKGELDMDKLLGMGTGAPVVKETGEPRPEPYRRHTETPVAPTETPNSPVESPKETPDKVLVPA